MKIRQLFSSVPILHSLVLSTLALSTLLLTPSAQACLSCGCGGSGSSADLGAIGGASSLFSSGQHWLIQTGATYRQVTGAFNERGTWNPTPADSLMQSYQAVFGVNYFPDNQWTIGLQVPFQVNGLAGASWGSFGSIAPNDLPLQYGGGVGDVQLQGAYKFGETLNTGWAAWSSLSLPIGQVDTATPANTTGSGVAALAGGLLGVYKPTASFQSSAPRDFWDWWNTRNAEYLVNIGYSQALNAPPSQASPFFQGQSLMTQLQANLSLFPQWTVGLGLNGQIGLWSASSSQGESPVNLQWASRWRVVPSVQYELSMTQGVRLATGVDLPLLGSNSLTDVSAHLVYYQFFE
jgi:hypothetical protein